MDSKNKNIKINKFADFKKAEAADEKYYALLPIEEKVKEFLYLLNTYRPNNGKIERIVLKYPLGKPPAGKVHK